MGLHAVAAQQLQLVGDDSVHGNGGPGLVGKHQADLDVSPSFSEAEDGVEAGLGMAEGIDREVGAATGGGEDGIRDAVGLAGINRCRRSESGGKLQLLAGDVDSDDASAKGAGNHYGGQANASATVYGHPLSRRQPALVDDGPVRGGETAAQAGGGDRIDSLWQANQVRLGVVDGDVLGERPPVREAGLKLMVAYLVVSRDTLGADAAAADKGERHSVAALPLGYVRSDVLNHSGQLVARDMRQRNIGIVPHPAVPVTAADPGSLSSDDDASPGGRGVGHALNGYGSGERFEDDGFHGEWASLSRPREEDRGKGNLADKLPSKYALSGRLVQRLAGESEVYALPLHANLPITLAEAGFYCHRKCLVTPGSVA